MSLTANCLYRQRYLPHLVLETLVEPAAQQGGGVSPPQQDSLSDIEDDLEGCLVTPPSVILGALASRYPFSDAPLFIQLVSMDETWSSAILFDAVNITGILKNTLLSPGGEVAMSSLLMFTPLHSSKGPRRLNTVSNRLENSDLSLTIVLLVSPPEKL